MDKKLIFKKVKQELASRRSNIRGFNYQFFEQYIKAKKQYRKNIENGIDDSYKDGYATLFHCYDDVYKSYLYTKNSCAYCEFLEIIQPYIRQGCI